jgi:ketosteroid isomerase-like protein
MSNYLADLLALQVLNTNFMHHVNGGEFDALPEYLTEDAVFEVDGQTQRGHEQITARLRADAARIVRRILNGGLRIVIQDAEVATGTSVHASFKVGNRGAITIAVYDVDDLYRLSHDGRWRIAQRVHTSLQHELG